MYYITKVWTSESFMQVFSKIFINYFNLVVNTYFIEVLLLTFMYLIQ